MTRPKQYEVELTEAERIQLEAFTRKGIAGARELRRARILLLAAEGRQDAEVAAALGCCPATVARIRRRCAEAGVEAALRDRPAAGREGRGVPGGVGLHGPADRSSMLDDAVAGRAAGGPRRRGPHLR